MTEAILSQQIGWLLLISVGTIWVGLGLLWGRKARSLDGFMLAGRNVGLALGTATAVATWVTSNTTMLAPQFALQFGVWGMIAYSTACVGLILFAPLAKRIQTLMPNGYTSGDFIRLRYGKKSWFLFLLISLFYSITWLISMAMAGGILLQTISGIPYFYGMSGILFVCVLYTLFGGLYAVIGTDFIQSLIILLGILIVGYSILSSSSIDLVYNEVLSERPALLWVLMPASIMALFNNLLFGVGEIFHSNVWWSRAFAIRSGLASKAYLMAGFIWLPIPVAAGFIALSANVMNINVFAPDAVGPIVAAHSLGAIGAIIIFIVIFSSLASSIDSLLAATSDLITQDIVKKKFFPQIKEQILKRYSKVVIVTIGFLAWAICLPRIGTLASVLFFAGPLVGSTIWPILSGLFWEKLTGTTAFLAMLIGSLLGLFSYFYIGWYAATLISTLVSMTFVFCGHQFTQSKFNWNDLAEIKEKEG